MKRYYIYPYYDCTEATEDETGDWVRHSDVADYDALRAVVDALPKCDECQATGRSMPAISADGDLYGVNWRCAEHCGGTTDLLPYAKALQALAAK